MDEQNKKELLRKRMKSIARGYLQFAEAFSYYCYLLRQDETPENRMAFIKQVGVSLDCYVFGFKGALEGLDILKMELADDQLIDAPLLVVSGHQWVRGLLETGDLESSLQPLLGSSEVGSLYGSSAAGREKQLFDVPAIYLLSTSSGLLFKTTDIEHVCGRAGGRFSVQGQPMQALSYLLAKEAGWDIENESVNDMENLSAVADEIELELHNRKSKREGSLSVLSKDELEFTHITPLLKIVAAVQQRYYGATFDEGDTDSYPAKNKIIDWVQAEFGIKSQMTAGAVERVATPFDRNKANRK